MKRLILLLVSLAGTALPAVAHTPETIAGTALGIACEQGSLPPDVCSDAAIGIGAAFAGLDRAGGGISYGDARGADHCGPGSADPQACAPVVVDIDSFYFSPRIIEVDLGQTVIFRNAEPAGGNRHKVASSDWLAGDRALPVPGLSFGGGTQDGSEVAQDGFQSQFLQPGSTWPIFMEVRDWPGSVIALGIDKMLIPYHCNVHGASQMNGYLLLTTKRYGGP